MAKTDFATLARSCPKSSGPVVFEAKSLSSYDACQLVKTLSKQHFEVAILEGAAIKSKRDLMKALAKEFDFPGHFGENWDALIDCLSAMGHKGCTCILLDGKAFRAADRETHDMFVEVCKDVAERFKPEKIPFKLVCC